MNKIPSATELIRNKFPSHDGVFVLRNIEEFMVEFAKLHVKGALEAAASNAKLKAYPYNGCHECGRDDMYVDKKSILNAYPENLIV